MRHLICQKTDIATYASQQNAHSSETPRRVASSRGRGRGRGRGRSRSAGADEGEYEVDLDIAADKKRARSLGDQILEMQAKKAKMEYR